MSEGDNQQEQQETVEERIIKLSINLPEAPGQLQFPVSVNSSIVDIVETLNILPATQQYTSFKLIVDGDSKNKLDDNIIVDEIVSAEATTLSLTLKQTAYTEKSVRDHLIKVREIACLETPSFYNSLYDISGVNVGASTFSDLNLGEIKPRSEEAEEPKEKIEEIDADAEAKAEAEGEDQPKVPEITVSEEVKSQISDLVSSLTTSIDENSFAAKANLSISPCLRSLHVSAWSPAEHQRSLLGDLLYLQCQTLEGETFHITAHVSGFFVNNSSVARFDGTQKQVSSANGKAKLSKSHSLLTLIRSLSPKFQEQLIENSKTLNSRVSETFGYPTTSFLANPWFVDTKNTQKKQPDLAKTQANYIEGGLDGADLQKDWNTEYQTLRELEINSQDDRLIQEKLLNKTSFEFTTAAIKGAVAIVKGEVTPMNPDDPVSEQIFLRNSIFYSFGDAPQFKDAGGFEAARAAAGKDLNGVKCLNRLNIKGVYHLCTTVVDYCGKRVLCQTPAPGIFNQAPIVEESGEVLPESRVVYGSAEEGTILNADEEFTTAFTSIAEAFHLKPHTAWLKDGSKSADLVTSLDTKGLNGTDGRKYIIDLYRTTPLDIEFIEKHFDLSKDTSYPHREVTLRNEAVQEWYARQVSVAIKAETERLEKENKGKDEKAEKPDLNIDSSKFTLNPDAFNLPYDSAPSKEALDQLKEDEVTVREASKFISDVLIPEFIREVANNEISIPIDGTQLTASLHNQGINLRYLGAIAQNAVLSKEAYSSELKIKLDKIAKDNEQIRAEEAEKAKVEAEKAAAKAEAGETESTEETKEEEEQPESSTSNLDTTPVVRILNTLYSIAVNEMIARATKHYLRKALIDVPLPLASYVIAHVHNGLIGSKANGSPSKPVIDSALLSIYDEVDLSILEATPADIQSGIAKEVYSRFRFELPANYANDIKPLALLRDIAISFGIQWKAREYAFTKEQLEAQVAKFEAAHTVVDDKKKSDKKGKSSSAATTTNHGDSAPSTTFTSEDIVSLVPVVKDSIYRSMMIEEFVSIARKNMADGETENALAHVKATVSLNESVYGSIHPDVAASYNVLSQFYYDIKMFPESCEAARKAFQIYERTKGIDSYEANISLSKIAFGESANETPVNSYIAYKRMLDQLELVSGNREHPNYSTALSSIGSSLQSMKLFNEAIKVFEYTLQYVEEGEQLEGLLHYQIGNSYILLNKLPLALEHLEKSAKNFEVTLGLKDNSYIQANKWVVQLQSYLAYLKQQQKAEAAAKASSKKGKKQPVASAIQAQAQAASTPSASKNGKSKKKKAVPNPELAQKSIDDIMKFIEGGSSNPSKKNKKNKV